MKMLFFKELLWMQQNPGKMPPSQQSYLGPGPVVSVESEDGSLSMGLDSIAAAIGVDNVPTMSHLQPEENTENVRLKKDGTPDLRYKKSQ